MTGADAPLRGVSSEVAAGEEGESLREIGSRRGVTFVDSTGGPGTSPPSSQESPYPDTSNGSSGDRAPLSVVSGDTPASPIVASSVSVENGGVGSGELQQLTQTAMVAAAPT